MRKICKYYKDIIDDLYPIWVWPHINSTIYSDFESPFFGHPKCYLCYKKGISNHAWHDVDVYDYNEWKRQYVCLQCKNEYIVTFIKSYIDKKMEFVMKSNHAIVISSRNDILKCRIESVLIYLFMYSDSFDLFIEAFINKYILSVYDKNSKEYMQEYKKVSNFIKGIYSSIT